jgi:hypothetical protein
MSLQEAGQQPGPDSRQRREQQVLRLRELLKPRPRRRPSDALPATKLVRGRSRDDEVGD